MILDEAGGKLTPRRCLPRGIGLPVARFSASLRLLFVGPTALPQKINFSSHMLRKAVCSQTDTDTVFMFLSIYPFHPPMLLVSILKDAFPSKRKGLSAA